MSVSSRVSANGFSTNTGFPKCSASSIGATCSCSGVDTITLVTSGWLITLELSLDVKSAPTCCASRPAFSGSISEMPKNCTDGCLLTMLALSVPMRPAPIIPIPSSVLFIKSPFLLQFSAIHHSSIPTVAMP